MINVANTLIYKSQHFTKVKLLLGQCEKLIVNDDFNHVNYLHDLFVHNLHACMRKDNVKQKLSLKMIITVGIIKTWKSNYVGICQYGR